MAKAALKDIVRYCDKTLRTAEVEDYTGALNGLQAENDGTVTCIAAAVDASCSTIRLALAAGADLLIVHHGLFWSARQPWTGPTRELLRLVLDGNLAVYSSHLPLDLHPKLGNNVQLSGALGLRGLKPFFFSHKQHIGVVSQTRLPLQELRRRLQRAVDTKPVVVHGGPDVCKRIGVVTGGAGSELKLAAAEGVDTFVTGEGPHWTYAMAEELGLNLLYGGHYATETFGVKALAADLAKRFRLPWSFIHYPTGL